MRILKQLNKSKSKTALFVGSIFALSFVVFDDVAANLFLRLFPSENEDDVRFDLFLPVYLATYILSSFTSYLFGKVWANVTGKKLIAKTHIRFMLIAPLLFLIAYFGIFVIMSLFLAISYYLGMGHYGEWVDVMVLYSVFFTIMVLGYYHVLKTEKN